MDHILECVLLDPSVEPTNLPVLLLKTITNDFSDDQKIGSGGFATVYKGVLENGAVIAVKKLLDTVLEEETFTKEVVCLMKARHKNIVRFLGYCSDTQGKIMNYEGKMVQAEERQRLLCFEFLPKGSLDKYITDVSGGLEWRTRYKIIEGICEGLHYLHENNIVHLDLKPANILLDDYMVPKIADFGISRCFDEKQTRAITKTAYGTLGYMAPEFYNEKITITFKSDIYSLGIIIMETLTGIRGHPDIDNVLTNWSTRFKNVRGNSWLLEHVKECLEMGIKCIDMNPQKRPNTRQIIDMLGDMDHRYGFNGLDVYPLRIWFPPDSNSVIKCPVTLTNKTDDFVGVHIAPSCLDMKDNPCYPYVWEQSEDDQQSLTIKTLWPHSSKTIYMTMRKQEQSLVAADIDLTSFHYLKKDLTSFDIHWMHAEDPFPRAKELRTVMHLEVHRAADIDPAWQGVRQYQLIEADPRWIREHMYFCCMDMHPTETWLLVAHKAEDEYFGPVYVSIWNYETGDRVTMFEVEVKYLKEGKYVNYISSIKFIPEEEWFAAGDDIGGVHVYRIYGIELFACGDTSYRADQYDKLKEFEAHRGDGREGSYLAVSPEHTLLLTASDKSIKLWDWSKDWKCTRVIHIDTYHRVCDLKVGPRDASTFACSTDYDQIKVWDIHSLDVIATFKGQSLTFYPDSHQDIVATISRDGRNKHPSKAKIWDLQTKKHVHTLYPGIQHWDLVDLACHRTLPIMAGITGRPGSKVHHIVLWDVRTYRVVKRVELLMEGYFRQMVFDGTEDIIRDVGGEAWKCFFTELEIAGTLQNWLVLCPVDKRQKMEDIIHKIKEIPTRLLWLPDVLAMKLPRSNHSL